MSDSPTAFREAQAVARRCVVLMGVVSAGHGLDRGEITKWLQAENLWPDVSPQERELLTSAQMSRGDAFNATWRVEAMQPLAWALGLVDEMGSAESLCDVARLQGVIPGLGAPAAEFVASAKLRSEQELLDANELAYQQHWKARDAKLNKKKSAINLEVIQERHHGLNWLIGYHGLDWDLVTTDT